LFNSENLATEEGDFKDYINPNSLTVITNALAEPSLATATLTDRYQFIRKGYYCLDKDSTMDNLIFNRTITLKDTWAKKG
jgi:glutaminyl-tRNA synthetase